MASIDLFRMERYQARHFHVVEHDLSESGVRPLSIAELLGEGPEVEELLRVPLGYPLSEGSRATREQIASWYPGAVAEDVTLVNGTAEAIFLTLWTVLEPGDRLAYMVPNYLQGLGLGRHFAGALDTFALRQVEADGARRWALDLEELERAVGPATKAVMVCHPDNPTGHVLTAEEMAAVIAAARRAGAWVIADEVYRGAEIETETTSPTFWGRYERTIVLAGLSKAFGLPGLRVGWALAPRDFIERLWEHHDYTTLAPSMPSDLLCRVAMTPAKREWILSRTRRILREHLPPLEAWIAGHGALFRYARPRAGAIAYLEYDLPVEPSELVERIRRECDVLLVSSDMFGLSGRGLRVGFGYDIGKTLQALRRVDELLARMVRAGR